MNFINKTALVTGAGIGIGRTTALEFAQNGANVVICDFNEDTLKKTEVDISALGGKVTSYICDVSDEHRVKELCEAAVKEYGKIDILVNNAGLYRAYFKPFLESNSDEWRRLFNVNVLGTMYFCYNLLPQMILSGYGRIINVGSVAGEYGLANFTAYSATKGAISSFTIALAKEATEHGVTVNSILPGMIDEEGHMKKIEANAIKRTGKPEECSKLIAFLASDDAGYISGQNYKIDGCRMKI